MPTIENKVSRILGERLLSITDVAERTGISRNTLTAIYYRKTKGVQFETVIKLCDYLQVPMSELFEYEPIKTAEN